MSPPAPPVVAVVTVCDAGPWLEEALAALGEQDYPNMSVLVLYPASTVDPTSRVDAVLPGAFVRRVDRNDGYAATTNHVLEMIEGASHFLLCHDDVAPDGGAVRLMVEEAFRSNAGVVCPKLVAWDAPDRLLQVGMTADKSGAPSALAERGELDQEQHDAVRDVFVAPGGCTLVRADLFATLGGYDGEMFLYGEDLDLSWRAQVAGARVGVAPGARARHLEAMSTGRRPGGASWPWTAGCGCGPRRPPRPGRTRRTCASRWPCWPPSPWSWPSAAATSSPGGSPRRGTWAASRPTRGPASCGRSSAAGAPPAWAPRRPRRPPSACWAWPGRCSSGPRASCARSWSWARCPPARWGPSAWPGPS